MIEFNYLPNDVKALIASHLSMSDLGRFAQLNKECNKAANKVKRVIDKNTKPLELFLENLTSAHPMGWLIPIWRQFRECKQAAASGPKNKQTYDFQVYWLAQLLIEAYRKYGNRTSPVLWLGLYGMYTSLRPQAKTQPEPWDWRGPNG